MKKLVLALLTLVLAGSMIVLAGCSSAAGTETTKASEGQTTSSAAAAGTTSADAASTTAAAATTAAATAAADTTAAATQKVFTLDELKTYDGQNGNPAYVAVSGIVYDVTNVKGWNNGSHQGMTAGTDLTSEMSNSPHGMSACDGITIVGTLG